MRKYGLIRCVIAEMLVAREHIMHESCSATPVTENKYRVVLQRFVRQQLLITFVLQGANMESMRQTAFVNRNLPLYAASISRPFVMALNVFQSAPTSVLIGSLLNSNKPILV